MAAASAGACLDAISYRGETKTGMRGAEGAEGGAGVEVEARTGPDTARRVCGSGREGSAARCATGSCQSSAAGEMEDAETGAGSRAASAGVVEYTWEPSTGARAYM
jgi:hypothetical protein